MIFVRVFLSLVCMTLSTVGQASVSQADSSTVLLLIERNDEIVSQGTGFFIGNTGHLITNEHVVRPDGRTGDVAVIFARGDIARADIIRVSSDKDLALLKLSENRDLEGVIVSSSLPDKGSTVFALGFPSTQISNMILMEESSDQPVDALLTDGVVSRTFNADIGGGKSAFIQHTAEVRQGNSGGPLVNQCGHVIGINTFIVDASAHDESFSGTDYFAVSAIELLRFIDGDVAFRESAVGCGSEEVAVTKKSELVSPSQTIEREDSLPPAPLATKPDAEAAMADDSHRQEPNYQLVFIILVLGVLVWLGTLIARRDKAGTRETGNAITSLNLFSREKLVTLSGFDSRGNAFSLPISSTDAGHPDGVIIGRSRKFCDALLDDETVSRVHLQIKIVGNTFLISDLNSTNRTKINGATLQPFAEQSLKAGDSLKIGSVDTTIAISS